MLKKTHAVYETLQQTPKPSTKLIQHKIINKCIYRNASNKRTGAYSRHYGNKYFSNFLLTDTCNPIPVGKIAEKAACKSVFLTIWHWIFSAKLTKTYSFRPFFVNFAHWNGKIKYVYTYKLYILCLLYP